MCQGFRSTCGADSMTARPGALKEKETKDVGHGLEYRVIVLFSFVNVYAAGSFASHILFP